MNLDDAGKLADRINSALVRPSKLGQAPIKFDFEGCARNLANTADAKGGNSVEHKITVD